MSPVIIGKHFVTEPVMFRPAIFRTVVGAKQSINPRQMDREILVAGRRFRAVMPVMKPRRHDPVLDTAKTESDVRVNEDGVKRDEHQVRVDGTVREAEQRNRNECEATSSRN